MKFIPLLALALAATIFIGALSADAGTLLDDHFNDGVLATNPATGGGFVFLDNGVNAGTGSVSESGSQARIVEGTGSNTSGILSSDAFDLSNAGLRYTATWQVAGWTSAGSGTGVRRTFFTLQSNNSWLFGGDAEESRMVVEISEVNNNAYLLYQNRSGGTNTNYSTSAISLGALAGDTDGFTATLVLDSAGFSFTTVGLNASTQVNLTGTWAGLGAGTNFATVLGTDGPMHVGAYTSGGYSLILYSDTDKGPVSGDRTSVFIVTPSGGSPIVVLTEDDASAGASTFNGTYVPSDNGDTGPGYSNYTVIGGLTASGFTLAITSPGDGGRGGLCGFQIVAGSLGATPPAINSFTADSTTVAPGSTVELSWTASSFDTLTLDPGGINAAALTSGGTGATTVTVNASTTYTLTANSNGQSVQSQVTVATRAPAKGPNVLVFLVDDMGITDTSVPFIYNGAGDPVTTNFNNFYVTPNMENLASRGMKFTQAYATPACSPTRCSLMTGLSTPRHGVCLVVNPNGVDPNRVEPLTDTHSPPNNWKRTGLLPSDAVDCMPKVLRDAGYRTIHVGKGHFGSTGSFAADPTALGFDVNIGGSHVGQPASYTGTYGVGPGLEPYFNTGTFLSDALTREMNKAIEKSVDDGLPFFAYMSHYAAHAPFTTDPNATGNYAAGVNTDHRKFATLIEGMDKSLGSILTKLEQLGVARDTLVIFLGDNGSDSPAVTANGLASGAFGDFPLRGKKATAWEGGVRVPMLVSWAKPDAANAFQTQLPITPGSRQNDIVTVWDIFPTILGVTGVAPPRALDGYDLSSYLRGTSGTHRPQQVLSYWPGDHNNDFFAMFRDEDWKLIYRFATDSFELYNLGTDPTESNNLATSDPGRVMAMARAMARDFDGNWGGQGMLWPTFTQSGARPYPNDPLIMPSIPTVDTDGDGIPDNGEDPDFNGLLDPGETNPDAPDSDQDGTKDGAEVRTGTDPLNPVSFFKATPSVNPSGRLIIAWPSKPGALYKIESSATLQGNWSPVADNLPANAAGTTTSYDLGPTTSPDRNFFRVLLKD